tara:strand:+ start:1932 stop:2429 length:498 start_codon:yes stop_codon:yes gene_type:complete
MNLRIGLAAYLLILLISTNASADGGGHKEVLPDETVIGISLVCSFLTYFFIQKFSNFELESEERIASSLIMFTIVVHTILGIDDLKLLAGAVGFLGFGITFFVFKIPFVEDNRTNISYLFMMYTLSIVIFYVYLHPDLTKNGSYDLVGILTKIAEVGIIALLLRN